jgi:hypothetical protein
MTSASGPKRADAEFLEEKLAEIPRYYSPVLHFMSTSSIGIGGIALAAVMVESFGWGEFTVVIAMVVIANLVEWIAHKEMLHKKRRYWEVLYEQHTVMHHRMYREDSMAVGGRKEWAFTLMPAKGVLGVAILGIPIALTMSMLFGPDVGWVALATIAGYVSAYEVLHLSYHLTWKSRTMRFLVGALSRHHARHHHPPLMRNYNMNVTIPLWDWILGTMAPKPEKEDVR